MSDLIKIKSIVVHKDRLVVVVQLDPNHFCTTPIIANHIKTDFPDITKHSCINSKGDTFGDVINNTSLVHVLEHLTIDIQASRFTENLKVQQRREKQDSQKYISSMYTTKTAYNSKYKVTQYAPLLKGYTRWIDKKCGIAQVHVSILSDVCAIEALNVACKYINSLSSFI